MTADRRGAFRTPALAGAQTQNTTPSVTTATLLADRRNRAELDAECEAKCAQQRPVRLSGARRLKLVFDLSVAENLAVPLERPGPWTIARIHGLFPRLQERRANLGRQLSGGEQEMLAIARALLLNPKLLLLDEPSQGLAPRIVQEVFRVVGTMRDEGIAVLLVEQNVHAAVRVADRAYVLENGRIAYEGSAAEFARDEDRMRALAGATAEKWELIGDGPAA